VIGFSRWKEYGRAALSAAVVFPAVIGGMFVGFWIGAQIGRSVRHLTGNLVLGSVAMSAVLYLVCALALLVGLVGGSALSEAIPPAGEDRPRFAYIREVVRHVQQNGLRLLANGALFSVALGVGLGSGSVAVLLVLALGYLLVTDRMYKTMKRAQHRS
jgi:hypothetical protein